MRNKKKNYKKFTLFIGNLDHWLTDKDLRREFGKFGEIHTSRIKKEGFGFVEYKNKDSENNAKDKKVCREQLKHVLRHGSVTSIDFAKNAQTPIRRLKSFGNN